MLVSLATGASFTAGVVIVIVLYQVIEGSFAEDRKTWIVDPDVVFIEKHSFVPEQPTYTVRGVIRNRGDDLWQTATIHIDVYAGSAHMNTCVDDVYEIEPRSTRDFQISCRNVGGQDLPDNVSYKIDIRYGYRVNF